MDFAGDLLVCGLRCERANAQFAKWAGVLQQPSRTGLKKKIGEWEERQMKTRAAVAFEAKKPLEIVELDLEGPKAGEVLVEIKATGICHTDA
ncbi:MAG: hypothetical protein ACRECG_01685, partial [Bradyrhizobium sp.]